MHAGLSDLGQSDHFPRTLTFQQREARRRERRGESQTCVGDKKTNDAEVMGEEVGREGVPRLDTVDQLCG